MKITRVLAVVVLAAAPCLAAPPDWPAVERALGKSGQLQAGDVFRVGMPRTDLSVTVKGVPVKAAFALGSYAAFKQEGAHAMVMGDLVLLDQEVPAVMSGLFGGGLDVTAVHNHVNEVSPHVMYVHYDGRGDAVQLATALRQALSASATPLGTPATALTERDNSGAQIFPLPQIPFSACHSASVSSGGPLAGRSSLVMRARRSSIDAWIAASRSDAAWSERSYDGCFSKRRARNTSSGSLRLANSCCRTAVCHCAEATKKSLMESEMSVPSCGASCCSRRRFCSSCA